MPKEIVHWMVAARTAELLSDGPFGPALSRCPNGLRLGAVYHDALFYLRGEHPEGMKTLPHRLHGSHGEDSFDLMRLQAAHLHTRKNEPLPTAFFVGLASHIFADATLHPMVYFFTGNYYDTDEKRRTGAVRRHRSLECLLDMLAAGGPEAVWDQSLRGLVNALEGPLALACPPESLARLAGCGAEAAQKALGAALGTYCSMQALCRMPILAGLLRDFSGLLPASLREIAALFYAPQLYEQKGALEGRLSYRNPASGDRLHGSLAELMELAARRTAAFCTAQAKSIAASGVLMDEGVGPSLDMGLPGVPVTQARYFATRLLPAD
ncbi:MAG: zinc dependent phospholipase C family protein [Humidesulfovibrio sp.]|nr:zinc dependent phospholipase C family protein [Humidesulfovibrio sp.]